MAVLAALLTACHQGESVHCKERSAAVSCSSHMLIADAVECRAWVYDACLCDWIWEWGANLLGLLL